MKRVAIVLAAGQGKRMNCPVQKQYLLIKDKPVLYYCLHRLEQTAWMDEIVLVTGADQIEYCRTEIVQKYGFQKVTSIVPGGKERSDSVACGLMAIDQCDYVYIHDGARPFLTGEMLERLKEEVERSGACVAAVPSKDTVKLADAEQNVASTPDRSIVWMVQTPQVFDFALVKECYRKFLDQSELAATDDAMVVEAMSGHKVRLVEGDYQNIKITTPEDLEIAEIFAKNEKNR